MIQLIHSMFVPIDILLKHGAALERMLLQISVISSLFTNSRKEELTSRSGKKWEKGLRDLGILLARLGPMLVKDLQN